MNLSLAEMKLRKLTYQLRVNVIPGLMDPLEREGDHARATTVRRGLYCRGEGKDKAREEQREGKTELHSELKPASSSSDDLGIGKRDLWLGYDNEKQLT